MLSWFPSALDQRRPPAANAVASSRPRSEDVAVAARLPPAVTDVESPKRTRFVCVMTAEESASAAEMTPPPATTTCTVRSSPSIGFPVESHAPMVEVTERSPPIETTLCEPISASTVLESVPLPRAMWASMIPPARASAYTVARELS